MDLPVIVSLDLLLFLRIFAAFSWGLLYAVFLQHHRIGKFWAEERAWLAVVIGIGIDLAISFNASYFATVTVIVVSSFGIVGRSLSNEQQKGGSFCRNKVFWNLEDAIALCNKTIELLHHLLSSEEDDSVCVSQAISVVLQIKEKLINARKGEYE